VILDGRCGKVQTGLKQFGAVDVESLLARVPPVSFDLTVDSNKVTQCLLWKATVTRVAVGVDS